MIIKDDPNIPLYIPGEYICCVLSVISNIISILTGGEQWRGDVRMLIGEELIGGYNIFVKITKDIPIG